MPSGRMRYLNVVSRLSEDGAGTETEDHREDDGDQAGQEEGVG